jgi:hypothetical protein
MAPRGTFAVEQTCPAEGLEITVNAVGPLRFPISTATARALGTVARPAPFGQGDRTLYDPRVRDTWEIPGRHIKIDARRWKRTLEGYMGNYGNTVDRWYHRAALVLWPRARTFVIRAKASPSWALDDLTRRIKAHDLASARDDARSLLPSWERFAPTDDSATFFPRLLKLVLALDDAKLAHGLLAPFGPSRLESSALTAFSAAVERYGAAWARGLFTTWFERRRHDVRPSVTFRPCSGVCWSEHLCTAGRWQRGCSIARWTSARRAASRQASGLGSGSKTRTRAKARSRACS